MEISLFLPSIVIPGDNMVCYWLVSKAFWLNCLLAQYCIICFSCFSNFYPVQFLNYIFKTVYDSHLHSR